MIAGNISIELSANVARISRDMEQARRAVGNATAGMARAANVAKNALASIGAGIGLAQIIQMSDQYAKFTAQLRLATQSQREYAAAYSDVKRISTSAQQDLQATGMLYARIANGTRELGTSQKQVAAITETVNMALKVSGATTAEAASAQLQLSQAFASGTLRGEEFNAVNEAAPRLMKALADGMGVPVGALKEMATEGQITSKIMADVLPRALEDLRNEAKEVQTIAGAFTVLKNNVMEFVGVQANASGGVAVLTGAIGLLASNLGVLAGAALTLMAAKLGIWLSGLSLEAYKAVAANQALSASNLATANSHVAATAASVSLTSARVAELRAAVLAAEGNVALAITTNGLIPAQARATAAATAHTAALAAQSTAMAGASVAGGIARTALGFLGGPIGAIITLLGLGATAWAVWGNKAKEGNDLAKESAVEASTVIIAELDKQIEKNQRIIEMRKQGATIDQANKSLKNTAALGALGNDLASLNRGDGQYKGMSNDDKFFAREKIMKSILDLQGKIALAETTGAAAKALTVAEARNKFMGEYATKQEQMNAKLKEARDLLGTSFTAEDEARIRKHYEVKAAVSKATSKVESEADKARLKAAKEIADAAAEAAKVQSDYAAKLGQTVAEANREAAANEELVRTYGMSKAAIEAENIARMEAQVERLRGIDMADDEIAALELVIATKKRSATAMSSVEAMAASRKATEDTIADYKKMSESIRDSLTDALLRGFESGKSFGRNLIDTLKNMFKTLVLQPTIQGILAPVAGGLASSMMPGAANAATAGGGAGSAVSGLGMLGSLTSGVGLLGAGGLGLQAGFGALMSGGLAGVSAAVSGGIAAIGAGTGASIAAGMGTIAGALGPIALGIGAAVVLLNKAFGRGPKEVTGTTMNGSFGANGFSGTTDAAWKKEGGWLRSDKTGIDKTAIDAAVAKEFSAGYDAIKSASADFANVLGLNAASIKNRSQSLSIALTKDEETNKKAITDFFVGIGNSIASELLPTISDFAKEGEGASATLQRLATNYATIDAALNAIGLSFGAVGVESLTARERIVDLSGGIEALTANAAGFAQNFLTEAERIAPVAEAVKKAMADLGFSMVDTRDEFKELVLGLDLTTEEGAKTYASLMKIQGAFALANPAVEAIADVVIDFAEVARAAAQVVKDAAAGLLGNVDSSMAVLQRVVSAEKSRLSEAHAVTMKALQQRIDTETAGIAKHKALSDAIASTLGQMAVQGGEEFARSAAQAQITAALAMARAGAMPSADSLKGALSILSKDSTDMFSTMQDYQRDFYRTQNELVELGKLSDVALSVEEKTLAALIAQKDSTQAAFDAEIARLDAVVESAQKQIDLLNGIDTSGITIIQALEAVRLAILSAQQNPVVAATASINSAYQSSLGRAPDAAGMDYWKNQAAAGMSSEQIAAMINGSAEAKAQALFQSVLGRAGDAGGIAYWTSALSGGMSEQAARDLMMQSDEYKKRIPGFANGGDHMGGLRWVGEFEPELEATGPSRIHTASALMSSLRSPSDNSAAVVAELRAVREELAAVKREVSRGADGSVQSGAILDKVSGGGGAFLVEPEGS